MTSPPSQRQTRAPVAAAAAALFVSFSSLSAPAAAWQQAPLEGRELPLRLAGGPAHNRGGEPAVVLSFPVRVEGAPWLRLDFESVELSGSVEQGTGAILRLTAHEDGAVQELNARHVREWQLTSAYFNGDAVQVEVLAWPQTGASRVVLRSVTAGVPPAAPASQCGPTDDRVLSSDPRSARALPLGCTAWLIDDCKKCFLSAGHCGTSGAAVIQFNVPLSSPTGALRNPPPEDQYSVDPASVQAQAGLVGQDWGYFGCFPNSNTGLTPFEAQGAAFELASSAPGVTPEVRITGYGADNTPASHNQVQQTHAGPYLGRSGTILDYRADTEGGNSGSPVIDEASGVAIGIHTHGGCTAGGGANSGTAIDQALLQTALANPLGVCRPLPGDGSASSYCTAKTSSAGCTPAIAFTGSPSASGLFPFTIDASQILNNKNGLLFYGYSPASAPFQGGTLCVAPPLQRTAVQGSGGNPPPSDCSGTYSFDMGARIASGQDPELVCGASGYAQYWYRDPQSPSFATGLTDGLRFTLGP